MSVQTRPSLARQTKGSLPFERAGLVLVEQEITESVGLDLGTPDEKAGYGILRAATIEAAGEFYTRLYVWGADGVWWPVNELFTLGEVELGGMLIDE